MTTMTIMSQVTFKKHFPKPFAVAHVAFCDAQINKTPFNQILKV